jgi:dUTP pyrophosphatase
VGLVHPRSGLALKHGVTVANAPGTIDAAFRGEIKVLLINHGAEHFVINDGDRIAQLVFVALAPLVLTEVDQIPGTHRGSDGFGSSGLH